MADLSGFTTDQIIILLNSTALTDNEKTSIARIAGGLVAAGRIPPSVLPESPTYDQVLAVLNNPAVDAHYKDVITTGVASASAGGLLPTLDAGSAAPPLPGGIDFSSLLDWVKRAARSYFQEIYDNDQLNTKVVMALATHPEEAKAIVTNAAVDAIADILETVGKYVTSGAPIAGKLAAYTINNISGTHINPDAILKDLSGNITRAGMVDIGTQFRAVVDQMFPIDTSTVNDRPRDDRQFALDNIGAYFGTNLNYQLRTLSIGILGSIVPGFDLSEFKNLHESLLWAYGLPWMSWSVMSAIMNVTTTKPLNEYYNARIKGNDFSEAEALNAYVQKRISLETLNQVLDNQGMRDDIRNVRIEQTRAGLTTEKATKAFVEGIIDKGTFDKNLDDHKVRDEVRETLIEEARPQLTESDLQDGYNHSLFTEQMVSDAYKRKGFAGFNLQAKVDLLKDARLFKLQEQLTNDYFRAYVLGKVTEGEFTQWLNSQGYKQIEIDIWLHRAQLEMKPAKERDFTASQIVAMVSRGGMDVLDGKARLIKLGYDDQEASDMLAFAILNHAVDQIPRKVKDEFQQEHPYQTILTAALEVVLSLDPTYPLRHKDFLQQIQRLLEYMQKNGI